MQNQSTITQQLFRETLLGDEEIYWIGEPAYNKWQLRRADIAFWTATLMIFLPAITSIFLLLYILVKFFNSPGSLQNSNIVSYLAFLIIPVFISLIGRLWRSHNKEYRTLADYLNYRPYRWWQTTFYAITSQRILISEQGRIRDYWYHLLDKPILRKSKNQCADILLYTDSYEAKKKKRTPLDVLRDISSNEAEDAFNILEQAMEEALHNSQVIAPDNHNAVVINNQDAGCE